MTNTRNRYADDWNGYSENWEAQYAGRYANLGDEWCDDGTAERRRDEHLFAAVAAPWLDANSSVLEIGPGGGKWTVRLASRSKEVVAFDVASAMLRRTQSRCDAACLTNVRFVLGDGDGLCQIADGSVDLVFSYDVFVHIALEDTVVYIQEMARVLKNGGVAVIHHAVNDVSAALDRIEAHNDWYRTGATLGQYYYHSQPSLRLLYERAGFEVLSTWTDYCTCVITVRRPIVAGAAGIEQSLIRAARAQDEAALEAATAELESAAARLQDRLAGLADELRLTTPGQGRYALIQEIRRTLRG